MVQEQHTRDGPDQPDPREGGVVRFDAGWLRVWFASAVVILVVVLLRYAVDVLALAVLVLIVGFSLNVISDWATEGGETVSPWSLGAVLIGILGTVALGVWLVTDETRGQRVLPSPIVRALSWAEAHGWGRRAVWMAPAPHVPSAKADGVARPPPTASPGTASSTPVPAARAPMPGRTPGSSAAGSGRPATARRNGQSASRKPDSGARSQPAATPPVADPSRVEPPAGEVHGPTIATATVLATGQSPSVVGRSVRLTARVRGATGTHVPRGTVIFTSGGRVLGSSSVRAQDGEAVAFLSVLDLPVGSHLLFAEFVGVPPHLGSRSAGLTQVVTRH